MNLELTTTILTDGCNNGNASEIIAQNILEALKKKGVLSSFSCSIEGYNKDAVVLYMDGSIDADYNLDDTIDENHDGAYARLEYTEEDIKNCIVDTIASFDTEISKDIKYDIEIEGYPSDEEVWEYVSTPYDPN